MKTISVVAILIICIPYISGCNLPGRGSNYPTVPTGFNTGTSFPSTGTFFSINEVGLGINGYVSLTNFTDQPASLKGLYLCQGMNCFTLPNVTVKAEQTVRIAVGDGAGLSDVVATQATLGELRPADGEIALSISNDPKDPKALVLYFQWGSNPHELTQAAVNDGLWVAGGYGPSSPTATRLFRVPETGLWLFDEP